MAFLVKREKLFDGFKPSIGLFGSPLFGFLRSSKGTVCKHFVAYPFTFSFAPVIESEIAFK